MNEKTNKFKIATLGCRTNQYESQAYSDQLKSLGFIEAVEGEGADICIVNTCTVTHSADRSSRQAIRELSRKHPTARLVVTGCLIGSDPGQVEKMDGVAAVIPNAQKEDLLRLTFPEEEWPEFKIQQFDDHTRAFVKVQDGCNSFCTYCVIPYVRGRSKSRTIESVVDEVHGLVARGYKEVVLTGINIGDFAGGLAPLVDAIDQVQGIQRVRLSSIDPDEVDQELQNAILNGKHTCHSLHIVLQSGSNAILKRMNRKYAKQQFLDTIYRLRAADGDFGFTTDVIVGFPGETERDFEETLEVIREVKFARVHMFPYSARPRTRAALYTNQVPKEVMQVRRAQLLALAEREAYSWREHFLGRNMVALLESRSPLYPGYFTAHAANFLPLLVPEELGGQNDLVAVRCVENSGAGLLCRSP
jgi:threonylcarbamoyladenosine tRNA methylthiotransferase MtaB